MQFINVCDEELNLTFQLNANGNLDLSLLKQYFPKSDGLIYKLNGQNHVTVVKPEEVLINSSVKDYNVFYASKRDSPLKVDNKRKTRITELLEEIKKKKLKKENIPVKTSETKLSSLTKSKERKITVGWLHRPHADQKYKQIKKPVAGNRQLLLNNSTTYSAQNILDLAKEIFSENKLGSQVITDSSATIGFFDGKVIHDFTNQDGSICDLWSFCKAKSIPPGKLHLYLLTTQKPQSPPKSLPKSPPKSPSKSSQESLYKSPSKGYVTVAELLEEKLDEEINFSTDLQENELVDTSVKDDISILYQKIIYSKYSNCPSVTELKKSDIYQIVSAEGDDCPEFEDFNPYDYGYKICNVEINGATVLQVETDDYGQRTFQFPSTHVSEIAKHSILYDYDIFSGFYEGRYGIGVLPYCDDHCNLSVIWYRNGEVYKQGPYLYFIHDPEIGVEANDHWSCEIRCNHH